MSAGGVVVRRGPKGPEVALAEQRDRNRRGLTVRLPKGHLDPGETPEAAAVREVREEIGVEARILQPLSVARYRFVERGEGRTVRKRVHFFLMRFESGDLHPVDGEFERVFWCDLESAERRLTFDTERSVVREARAALEEDDEAGL